MLNERLVEAPLGNMRSFDERYYMDLQSEIPTIRLENGSIVVNKLGLGEILQMQLDANGSLTVLRKQSSPLSRQRRTLKGLAVGTSMWVSIPGGESVIFSNDGRLVVTNGKTGTGNVTYKSRKAALGSCGSSDG
ncbi:uncharacterized protein LOC134844714 [Symsagittifera roscoffensis]|uniref:uncharacterized protein LOC134844714 n=1 Tax=Symsagittifera roscoffensis TaxID=84072 RepID=UPI00307CC236